MLEHMDKYKEAERTSSLRTIDMPVRIFLGLTIGQLIAGVITFFSIVFMWDSILSIPTAVVSAVGISWIAKLYSDRYPRRFLLHWQWSMGLTQVQGFPTIFKKRRRVTFGP